MKQLPIHDDLKGASRYVAAVAAWRYRPDRGFVPEPTEPTATVTFVKFDGDFYAVTAQHVAVALNDLMTDAGMLPGAYYCPVNKGARLEGPFINPPPLFPARELDIALVKVNELVLERLGKSAYELLPDSEMPWPLTHGLAVGFPTVDKSAISDSGGERLSMPAVDAVAEAITDHQDSDQIQFHSDLPEPLDRGSLSGMSGGAVFWSTDDQFGLAGFVKEALDVNPKPGEPSLYLTSKVNFVCQRVDYETMKRWVEHYKVHWPLEREKLNELARKQNEEEMQERRANGLSTFGDEPG